MNTDDFTSDWSVAYDESESASQREDFFFFKLAFHLVIRQMLSPVGVELVSDS